MFPTSLENDFTTRREVTTVKSFFQIIVFKLFHVDTEAKSLPQERCPGCAGARGRGRRVVSGNGKGASPASLLLELPGD